MRNLIHGVCILYRFFVAFEIVSVEICIYGSEVKLKAQGIPPDNDLGEVLVSTFLGRTVQYNVRTAIGEFVVKADQSQVYPLGASILLELSANKIILINPSNH